MPPLPVSAVVVNLDGGDLLARALDALEGEAVDEIVVVDNGSGAGEVSRLASRPGLRLLSLPENLGFAAPANLGAREARAPFVAFVNNDCVVGPGYLAACLAVLEDHPGLAAVQGLVLTGDGAAVDGRGIGWNARAEAIQLGRGEFPPGPGGEPFEVPGVSATASLFRRDLFLSAGGFAESFFAWYEDVDLALRLRRAGACFASVPEARAFHAGRRPAGAIPRSGGVASSRTVSEPSGATSIRPPFRPFTPVAPRRAPLSAPPRPSSAGRAPFGRPSPPGPPPAPSRRRTARSSSPSPP